MLRSDVASHQHVAQEAGLDRRVPSVEVHRRVRLRESDPPRRLDAVRIGPAGFGFREDEVRRAVQDALEGFEPRAAECLLEQVEHGRPVHHRAFVTEPEIVLAGEIAQLPIMVDDRTLVRGDYMLAAPQRRDQMIEGDLAGSEPQRGDLDDRVRSRPTNVFGRALRNPATARFQGDAGVREPQRPAHIDPARVLNRPVPRGQDRDDGGIESELPRQFGPVLEEKSSKFPPHVAETHEDDPTTHPIRLQMSSALPTPRRAATVTTSSATAASCTPTPVRAATVISCSDVRPRFSSAAISPSSAYTSAGRRTPASTA